MLRIQAVHERHVAVNRVKQGHRECSDRVEEMSRDALYGQEQGSVMKHLMRGILMCSLFFWHSHCEEEVGTTANSTKGSWK